MIFVRTLLASLALFEGLASAYVLQYHDSHAYSFENEQVSTPNPIIEDMPNIQPAGTKRNRDLLDRVTSNATTLDDLDDGNSPHELSKRVLRPVRQVNIATHLNDEVKTLVNPAENPNSNFVHLVYNDNGDEFSYATLKKLSDFKTDPLKIGTAGLTGCTVLTVVSSQAVYSGHFFESLAWNPDAEYETDVDTAFQENCLNAISGNGETWEFKGVAIDTSLFTGYNPVAVIMTPRADQDDATEEVPNPTAPGPETQKFQALVQRLVTTLEGLIPGLTVVFYNYIALDDPTDYKGIGLFEYDPSADGSGNANFRIWCEAAMEDAWSMGILPDPDNA